MVGSIWPSSATKPNERKIHHSPTRSADAPSPSLNIEQSEGPSVRPSMDHAVTAALSTPHDAVLEELYGQPRSSLSPLKTDVSPHVQGVGIVSSAGSMDRTVSPSFAGLRSVTSSPDRSPEPVYDPFSGGLAGVIMPPRPEFEFSNVPLDQIKDNLWAHLGRIRELQSEIAGLHVQMEGIGLGEVRGTKRTVGSVGRVHSDTIHSGEDWEDPEVEAAHGKAARDAEFTNLTESFKTRRTAIDGIMDKLGDLSESLTTFHALPTPMMDFTSTRSTTKESTAMSPDQPGPTRSTTAASHPDHSTALPESPVSIDNVESPVDGRQA